MTTQERIFESIMTNGFTKEEAEAINDCYLKVKAIKVDKHNGSWEYTSGAFAEKETQELALDMIKKPIPKGE